MRQDARVRDEPPTVLAALRAAQAGDEDGFRVLYRDMQPRLLRYLRVLVGSEAEDIAAESWLQITHSLGSFRGGIDDFRAWSTTIARHRALDQLRRESRRPLAGVPFGALADVPAEDDTAEAPLEAISTRTALALIASLPGDQAEAVLLRVVVGLDAKTAGQVLGKRPGAVRTSAYRGLNRLAARMTGVTQPSDSTLREVG